LRFLAFFGGLRAAWATVGYQFVARVWENGHTPSSFCTLEFNIQWEYSNASCCFNIDDDSSTSW